MTWFPVDDGTVRCSIWRFGWVEYYVDSHLACYLVQIHPWCKNVSEIRVTQSIKTKLFLQTGCWRSWSNFWRLVWLGKTAYSWQANYWNPNTNLNLFDSPRFDPPRFSAEGFSQALWEAELPSCPVPGVKMEVNQSLDSPNRRHDWNNLNTIIRVTITLHNISTVHDP